FLAHNHFPQPYLFPWNPTLPRALLLEIGRPSNPTIPCLDSCADGWNDSGEGCEGRRGIRWSERRSTFLRNRSSKTRKAP
ncbi:hypothetical protein VIGAN_01213200, partial [Vigna angularis var. angularis]